MEQKNTEAKPLSAAQQRQRDKKRRRWLRAGVQLFFFLTMPGAFVAGFSGVKHIFQWIGTGAVLQLDSFVLALIGLCVFTVLFGRYFCGFVCAFGGLGDLVYWLSGLVQKKLFHRKKQIRLPEKFLPAGQKVKYAVLCAIVVLCAFDVYGKLTGWSPWDVFSRLTALKAPGMKNLLGVVLFVLIVAGMAVQQRFFCQFLCPMGAVFALLPVLPFASLRRRSESCIPGCSACAKQCPVALKLAEDGTRGGECIACEACVDTCPRGNISRWDLHADGKLRWLGVLGKAALFFLMGVWLGFCRFITIA